MKRLVICMLIGVFSCSTLFAQELRDSVKIHFRQGRTELDMDQGENARLLQGIQDKLQLNQDDSIYYRLQKVWVIGSASPEGSMAVNKRLSEKRAESLFNYLSQYAIFPDSLRQFSFLGRDWEGLYHLADMDSNLPYRDETLALLGKIASHPKEESVRELQSFKGGKVYTYLYKHHFPALRASTMYVWYSEVKLPPFSAHTSLRKDYVMAKPDLKAPAWVIVEPDAPEEPEKTPFLWALKTNALYDLALVPNLGVEFYLGKNWSAGANGMYAWWKNDHASKYWRIYGGDIYARRWFGKKAEEKPLTGHHVGVYAQMLTYDFCLGNRGYMGGTPGGNLWDKASWAAGIEYGYSHPISRRLNLDFTIGIGYLQGEYHEYIPEDDCYVWQATKNRKWFGPTKAEVSLVWLLGHGNVNEKKGGRR